jgi:hypothetical protein
MAAAAHAAIHAAMANAIKANGVVVRVEAADFMKVLKKEAEPLVIIATGGVFKKHFQYLTAWKGLAFFTTSAVALELPGKVLIIAAGKISIPDI